MFLLPFVPPTFPFLPSLAINLPHQQTFPPFPITYLCFPLLTFSINRRCSRAILRLRPSSGSVRACSSTQPSERQCSHSGRWDRSSEGGFPQGTSPSSFLHQAESSRVGGENRTMDRKVRRGPRRSSTDKTRFFCLPRLTSTLQAIEFFQRVLNITQDNGEIWGALGEFFFSFKVLPQPSSAPSD